MYKTHGTLGTSYAGRWGQRPLHDYSNLLFVHHAHTAAIMVNNAVHNSLICCSVMGNMVYPNTMSNWFTNATNNTHVRMMAGILL